MHLSGCRTRCRNWPSQPDSKQETPPSDSEYHTRLAPRPPDGARVELSSRVGSFFGVGQASCFGLDHRLTFLRPEQSADDGQRLPSWFRPPREDAMPPPLRSRSAPCQAAGNAKNRVLKRILRKFACRGGPGRRAAGVKDPWIDQNGEGEGSSSLAADSGCAAGSGSLHAVHSAWAPRSASARPARRAMVA